MTKRTRRWLAVAPVVATLALTLVACDGGPAPAQNTNQSLSNDIENAASQNGHRYPLAQMKATGWTEEQVVTEHLLRESDPNAVRWIIIMTQQGQIIEQEPLRGMVFDPNSSLTETQDIACVGDGGGGRSCGVVNSPSDNGTYGPEAGCAAFFTTNLVEQQIPCGMWWIEADAPLNLTTQPLITYNVNAAPPSDNKGLLAKVGGH